MAATQGPPRDLSLTNLAVQRHLSTGQLESISTNTQFLESTLATTDQLESILINTKTLYVNGTEIVPNPPAEVVPLMPFLVGPPDAPALFTSIQDAYNAALLTNPTESAPARVFVLPGTYSESLNITGRFVYIQALPVNPADLNGYALNNVTVAGNLFITTNQSLLFSTYLEFYMAGITILGNFSLTADNYRNVAFNNCTFAGIFTVAPISTGANVTLDASIIKSSSPKAITIGTGNSLTVQGGSTVYGSTISITESTFVIKEKSLIQTTTSFILTTSSLTGTDSTFTLFGPSMTTTGYVILSFTNCIVNITALSPFTLTNALILTNSTFRAFVVVTFNGEVTMNNKSLIVTSGFARSSATDFIANDSTLISFTTLSVSNGTFTMNGGKISCPQISISSSCVASFQNINFIREDTTSANMITVNQISAKQTFVNCIFTSGSADTNSLFAILNNSYVILVNCYIDNNFTNFIDATGSPTVYYSELVFSPTSNKTVNGAPTLTAATTFP